MMDIWTDRQLDLQIDGWMDGWTDGQMEGRKNQLIEIHGRI